PRFRSRRGACRSGTAGCTLTEEATCGSLFSPFTAQEHGPRSLQFRLATSVRRRKVRGRGRANHVGRAHGAQCRKGHCKVLPRRRGGLLVRWWSTQLRPGDAHHAGTTRHENRLDRAARNSSGLGGSDGLCLARTAGAERRNRKSSGSYRCEEAAGARCDLRGLTHGELLRKKPAKTKRGPSAPASGSQWTYAEKDEPQPQVLVALGFLITNCAPSRPSV